MADGLLSLREHSKLKLRRQGSLERLEALRAEISAARPFQGVDISVFCAGSMARLEMGSRSDVDFFLICENKAAISRIGELEIFASLIAANRSLGYPEFSNDGEFLKIYPVDELVDKTGRPIDDSENFFTVRMLLLLESICVCNQSLYDDAVRRVARNYLRDKRGKRGFRPLFLLNDLLRYWRTLCLNYEQKRTEGSRKWRTKNLNLKFSRMMTVYSLVLLIAQAKVLSEDALVEMFRKQPLERLAEAHDALAAAGFRRGFEQVLDDYEFFLSVKEKDDAEIEGLLSDGGVLRSEVAAAADRFSRYFYDALMHSSIAEDARRFILV